MHYDKLKEQCADLGFVAALFSFSICSLASAVFWRAVTPFWHWGSFDYFCGGEELSSDVKSGGKMTALFFSSIHVVLVESRQRGALSRSAALKRTETREWQRFVQQDPELQRFCLTWGENTVALIPVLCACMGLWVVSFFFFTYFDRMEKITNKHDWRGRKNIRRTSDFISALMAERPHQMWRVSVRNQEWWENCFSSSNQMWGFSRQSLIPSA